MTVIAHKWYVEKDKVHKVAVLSVVPGTSEEQFRGTHVQGISDTLVDSFQEAVKLHETRYGGFPGTCYQSASR